MTNRRLGWVLAFLSVFAFVVWLNPVLAQNPFTLFGFGGNVDTNSGSKSGNTLRVVVATDQPTFTNAQPVTVSTLPLPSGAATEATLAQVATGSLIGAQTEAAPSTDTASSGLNGRLQRVAQNITALMLRVLGSNLVQVGSTAVDVNHGNVSAGTQRVVLPDNILVPQNLVQVGTTAIDTSAGNVTAGTQRVVLAANQFFNVAVPQNLVQVGTTAIDVNHGNVSAGTQRVVLADNILVPQNLVQVGTTAVAVGSGTTTNGTQRVVLATDQAALTVAPVLTVVAQPILPAGQGCNPYHLAGGTSASTNANSIKTSAGTLCDILPMNVTSTVYYLKMYDTSSASPNCATASTLKHVYPIPNASGAGAGFVRTLPLGEQYALGIGYCVTGGGSDTDNTSAATGVYIEASFK